MKIDRFRKINKDLELWRISDWLKSNCREFDQLEYFVQNDIDLLAKGIIDNFDMNYEDAVEFVKNYYEITDNLNEYLIKAAKNFDLTAVIEFLKNGANIDCQDKNGDTVLIIITQLIRLTYEPITLLTQILSFNPNIYVKNKKGEDFYDVAPENIKKWIEKKFPEFITAKKYNL